MASTPSSLLLTTSDTGKVPPEKQSAKIVKEESLSSSASANTGAGAAVPSFLELAQKHGTDKVRGSLTYDACMADPSKCPRPQAYNDMCK
eukprot:scaffold2446_cov84-Amphora_coffeaeformis.AAC.1